MYTVSSHFFAQSEARGHAPLLIVPERENRTYLPEGATYTYGEAGKRSLSFLQAFQALGIGHGHRVALLLENRPEFYWNWFALNALGASIVPLNPDHREAELAHVFSLTSPDLCIVVEDRFEYMAALCKDVRPELPITTSAMILDGAQKFDLKPAPFDTTPNSDTECAVLFTSGTTGFPKACSLNNRYVVTAGSWYVSQGGRMAVQTGCERIYSTVPVFHTAGLALVSTGAIMSGNCLIQPERFSPKTLWSDAIKTEATMLHYLGVVLTLLMQLPETPEEKQHSIRLAIGAGGGAPEMQKGFTQRFGIRLCEGWAMTETGRAVYSSHEPLYPELYTFGRTTGDLEARIADDEGNSLPANTPGELLVRCKGSDPRYGFFSGYLENEEETEKAWRGGWFHTGDVASMLEDGTLCFVDRKKNIVRRSGENIAAAEVENVLNQHPLVRQSCVVAVPDPIREQEVFAFVELEDHATDHTQAMNEVFGYCATKMAYYKPPGWMEVIVEFPMTPSNKHDRSALLKRAQESINGVASDFRDAKRPDKAAN